MTIYTGGIGDVMALLGYAEAYPDKALLCTPRAGEISEVLNALRIPTRTIECCRTYHSKYQVQSIHGIEDAELRDLEDGSISYWFPKIKSGEVKYQKNFWEDLYLPKRIHGDYGICNPHTFNKPDGGGRDLTPQELNWVVENCPYKLYLIGQGFNKFPPHHDVISMINKMSVLETGAVIKHAKWYAGIDSWIGNEACKWGYTCYVKSINEQFYHYREVYQQTNHNHIQTKAYLGHSPEVLEKRKWVWDCGIRMDGLDTKKKWFDKV